MPVYQSEGYVQEAVESVLRQSLEDFELIIVDDASSDKSFEVLRRFRDRRIRLYRHARNLGPGPTWNRAMEFARGAYIKVLPGDDILMPECLMRQVSVLEEGARDGIVLAYCGRELIDRTGRCVLRIRFPGVGLVKGGQLLQRTVRYGTNIVGEPGAVLFRCDAARRAGPFDASLGFVTDLDYWSRLLEHGDAYAMGESLCGFRITGENWSIRIGPDRFRQYVEFIDRLAGRNKSLRPIDVAIGKVSARINEWLRRAFYLGLVYDASSPRQASVI
jgi:glycosyltransferase involved in cell wall biosynthesis